MTELDTRQTDKPRQGSTGGLVAIFFVTSVAATIAATARWSIVRTVLYFGGGFAVAVGVLLFAGLTVGTA
ncbi:hypothetical protein [Agromyces sp. Root81]|uniref:hypothetical protein n=1 Tax=Agromyces sp. Root81 TaxID=1736601 RepID=UPI000A599936|nr:hypothetical protein [Agromyces sp. Root81]